MLCKLKLLDTMAHQVTLLPQFQVLWFNPEIGLLSVWSFICSPHVFPLGSTDLIYLHPTKVNV